MVQHILFDDGLVDIVKAGICLARLSLRTAASLVSAQVLANHTGGHSPERHANTTGIELPDRVPRARPSGDSPPPTVLSRNRHMNPLVFAYHAQSSIAS